MMMLWLGLLFAAALFHDTLTMDGLPKSTEYVQTERGTLVLSCTELPDESVKRWAIEGLSPIRSRTREAGASEVLGGYVKDCEVVGIGIPKLGQE